jgi:hypothetical protein
MQKAYKIPGGSQIALRSARPKGMDPSSASDLNHSLKNIFFKIRIIFQFFFKYCFGFLKMVSHHWLRLNPKKSLRLPKT